MHSMCLHSISLLNLCSSAQSKIPFAVVGSNQEVRTADGRTVRGRAYPWGVIEVDNEDHCDFVKLRQMLVRTYMEELREHTNGVLYENYRTEKLLGMGVTQDTSVFKEIKYVSFHCAQNDHCIRANFAISVPLAVRRRRTQRSVHCTKPSSGRWRRR